MKTSLYVLTSSLICFTATDICADSLEQDAARAIAQQKMPTQGMTQTQSTGKMSCMKANNPHRIDIKHIEAKGIGYNQGYTSLDGFFTSMWDDFIPFLDLRAHLFNNGRWAANAGLGTRYIFDPCQWMVGGNVYYDYRSTKHGNYNQIGAGAEAFYDKFEMHLNGYLPVGQKRRMTKNSIDSVTFKGFSGNYILQNENYKNSFEGAMKGFNGELGTHIAGDRKCYDLYFGVGPYYYDLSSGKHAWGGKARLKAEVTKYLFLEVSDSYDRIFHNRFQGTVNVSIPFGGKLCYPSKHTPCSNVMDWQAALPVERQEIIVISKFKKKNTVDPVAFDPATGQPFFVIFVDNTNTMTGGGSGTYEDPYAFLTNNDDISGIHNAEDVAMDGNVIYVFAGDGSATGMSGGNMQLQPSNRLLGSANSHPFQTTKGLLTVPMLTTLVPNVQGPNTTNIINLANNCEVSGFNFSTAFTTPSNNVACIANNTGGTLTNANINYNTLGNQTYGLLLGTVTGTIVIANNTAYGQVNSGVQAFSYTGAFLNANTTIENNKTYGIGPNAASLFARSFSGNVFTINNNQFTTGLNGIVMSLVNTGSLPDQWIITENTVNNTSGASFLCNDQSGSSSKTIIFEENNFINAGVASPINTTTSGGQMCLRLNNNNLYPSNAGVYPITISAAAAGTVINLETPLNNFPQPLIVGGAGALNIQPACFCGQPCN